MYQGIEGKIVEVFFMSPVRESKPQVDRNFAEKFHDNIACMGSTIGYVIKRDSNNITIASSQFAFNTYGGLMKIPNDCIRSIAYLKKDKMKIFQNGEEIDAG